MSDPKEGRERQKEAARAYMTRHGHTQHYAISREYRSWKSMIQRATNPAHPQAHRYSARGITVCDRWRHSFENFLTDMGPRPEGKSLDRWPDNDGDYEPGNCRWATAKEQQAHRRKIIA